MQMADVRHATTLDNAAKTVSDAEGYTPRPTGRLWTAEQAADYLNVSLQALYRLARSRTIPTVRVGRWMRFDPAALAVWATDGGKGLDE